MRCMDNTKFWHFCGKVKICFVATEGDYVEPTSVYEAKQINECHHLQRAMKNWVWAHLDEKTWNQTTPPLTGQHSGIMGL